MSAYVASSEDSPGLLKQREEQQPEEHTQKPNPHMVHGQAHMLSLQRLQGLTFSATQMPVSSTHTHQICNTQLWTPCTSAGADMHLLDHPCWPHTYAPHMQHRMFSTQPRLI